VFHVYVEGVTGMGPDAVRALADAMAERYGLPAAELQARLGKGRFRVKANVDQATADAYARDLEAIGARVRIEAAQASGGDSARSGAPSVAPVRTSPAVVMRGARTPTSGTPLSPELPAPEAPVHTASVVQLTALSGRAAARPTAEPTTPLSVVPRPNTRQRMATLPAAPDVHGATSTVPPAWSSLSAVPAPPEAHGATSTVPPARPSLSAVSAPPEAHGATSTVPPARPSLSAVPAPPEARGATSALPPAQPRAPRPALSSLPPQPELRPALSALPPQPEARPALSTLPPQPGSRPTRPSLPPQPASRPTVSALPPHVASRPSRPSLPPQFASRPTTSPLPAHLASRPSTSSLPPQPASRPARPSLPPATSDLGLADLAGPGPGSGPGDETGSLGALDGSGLLSLSSLDGDPAEPAGTTSRSTSSAAALPASIGPAALRSASPARSTASPARPTDALDVFAPPDFADAEAVLELADDELEHRARKRMSTPPVIAAEVAARASSNPATSASRSSTPLIAEPGVRRSSPSSAPPASSASSPSSPPQRAASPSSPPSSSSPPLSPSPSSPLLVRSSALPAPSSPLLRPASPSSAPRPRNAAADAEHATAPATWSAAQLARVAAPRARLATGVLLAIVLGFLPAYLVASVGEDRAFRAIDAKVHAVQGAVDSQDSYDALDGFRAEQLRQKRRARQRVALLSMAIWAAAGSGLAYAWFKRVPWNRLG
jgi:hypothetical protein